MSDLQQAIDRLKSSAHYKRLSTYKPPFDPFEVMGVLYRERSHSKVLGWLLSDETNREFRQEFVSWIVNRLDNYNPDVDVAEAPVIRFEYGDNEAGRTDVFAHFRRLKLAVAIEVKVRGGEQARQIERYQNLLNRYYAYCDGKAVIFLTPLGEAPKTSAQVTGVPVLNMSWDDVARIIDNIQPEEGSENNFRFQFRSHLRRVIVMNEREEKRRVRDLLCEGDNARTIQRIIDNMPSLGDFSKQWKKIVAEVCEVEEPDSLELLMYPTQRSAPRELGITVPEWREAGLPFTLMLWRDQYGKAGVRILLWGNDFDTYREQIMEFAEANSDVVNNMFPQLRGWSDKCRAVLADDKAREGFEPPHTLINAAIYDDEAWEKEVKEKLESQMSLLLNLIQDWVKKNA